MTSRAGAVLFLSLLVVCVSAKNAVAGEAKSSVGSTSPLSVSSSQVPQRESVDAQYKRYLKDTLQSLDAMRGSSGLVADTVKIDSAKKPKVKVINSTTSPTNIALDILTQVGASHHQEFSKASLENLAKILKTLSHADYHNNTGLFYSWYETKAPAKPKFKDLSAIDNLHLALAFYTVEKEFRFSEHPELADIAKKLLDRMNFSVFYDSKAGLLHGYMKYENGTWKLDTSYHFGFLGSEARSLYSVGYALGLFRDLRGQKEFAGTAAKTLDFEFSKPPYNVMKTWDGSTFQLFLPDVLINEKKYSSALEQSAENYSAFLLDQQNTLKTILPPAHSASYEGSEIHKIQPSYNGAFGTKIFAASANDSLKDNKLEDSWESVITVHGVMLASTKNKEEYAARLARAEHHIDGTKHPLYVPGLGFMDGVNQDTGEVISYQLSLDQGMLALSLLKNIDGSTPSSRALAGDESARKKLTEFYHPVDQRLEGAMPMFQEVSHTSRTGVSTSGASSGAGSGSAAAGSGSTSASKRLDASVATGEE